MSAQAELTTVTGGGTLRKLRAEHTPWLFAAVDAAPATYCYIAQILSVHGNAEAPGGPGAFYGYFEDNRLLAAYWVGSTIVPVHAGPAANEACARLLNRRGRGQYSIIGPADAALDLAHRLDWGAPREVREDQPLLAAVTAPDVPGDRSVRRGRVDEADIVFPASVAMFEEELGFSPLEQGSTGYRNRVLSLLRAGSTFVLTATHDPQGRVLRSWPAEGGRQVVFKADLGLRSRYAAQIQGVWVHPEFRGRGIAARAMVSVTQLVLREVAPSVSLYANAFNTPALKSYLHAGYRQCGTFATVMY